MENSKTIKQNDKNKVLRTLRKFESIKKKSAFDISSAWFSPQLSENRSHHTSKMEISFTSPLKEISTFKSTNANKCQNCLILDSKQKELEAELQKFKEQNVIKEEENKKLHKTILKFNDSIETLCDNIEPYRNNVILMQQILKSIKQSLRIQIDGPQFDPNLNIVQRAFEQKQKNLQCQISLIKKTQQRDNCENQIKLNRLVITIENLQKNNKELYLKNCQLQNKIQTLQEIINESSYVIQVRELFMMASQQLYQLKGEKIKLKKDCEIVKKQVERLKNKIHLLTSLIGYGVISNLENNDLKEIDLFKENLQKINGIQERIAWKDQQANNNDPNSFNQGQNGGQLNLYRPNFMIFFDQNLIQSAVQEKSTTIIKSDFFITIRTIFDAKYSDFLIHKENSNQFSDFVYGFLQVFNIKREERRTQFNNLRGYQSHEAIKTTFLMRIFDKKIGNLSQITTFKEFLVKNTPKDEVFFFLLCRNFLHRGAQMRNYINCGDPYTYILYQRARHFATFILKNVESKSKVMIFNHLNSKKVLKNKNLMIKSGYVLRILLQIYRKEKAVKLNKLSQVFQQTLKMCNTKILKFYYFNEIMTMNFEFLTQAEISDLYRRSIALFQTNSQFSFFQTFNLASSQTIFLKQLFKRQKNLIKMEEKSMNKSGDVNFLTKLIPQSVSQLGNENLYHTFISLMKQKSLHIHQKVEVSRLLLQMAKCHLWRAQADEEKQEYLQISHIMDRMGNEIINWLNKHFYKREKYEKELNQASSKLGKYFRKKIHEFYSDFIHDINKQVEEINDQS